jgi:predicted DNA-binding transcriptional regulator AlpA
MKTPQRDRPEPDPLVYTPADLAAMLKLSPRKIRAMKSAGQLPPPIRFGRAVRWRRADIDVWLARRKDAP